MLPCAAQKSFSDFHNQPMSATDDSESDGLGNFESALPMLPA
jgi:hypothetical protein